MTFKTAAKKRCFEFKEKVSVFTGFGVQKIALVELAEFANASSPSPEDFVVCFDKLQEDWGFTEGLAMYGVEQMLLLYCSDNEDPDAKKDFVNFLKKAIKKIENS